MNEFEKIVQQVYGAIDTHWREDIYNSLTMGVLYVYGMAVEGDIAEFGTMTGRTAVALSSAFKVMDDKRGADTRLDESIRHKKLWFFDSFEGLPEARFDIDKNSHHVATGIWGSGTCLGLTYEQFNGLISQIVPQEKFKVVKGFFKDTISTVPDGSKFSLVHIDGDLYESAIDVLDSLFKRNMISRGAMVFFDDWNCNQADPDLGERRAWREVVETYKITSSDEGAYGYTGHKFIVHDYETASL